MRNQDFAKGAGEGLETKVRMFLFEKVAIGQHVEQTGAIQANWVDWGLGAKPTVVGQFLQFFEKLTIFSSVAKGGGAGGL